MGSGHERVERLAATYSRLDADALVAICDPDVEWQSRITAVDEATYRGHEGIRRYVAKLSEVFEWIDVESEVLEPGHPTVVVNRFRALGRGSHVEVEQRFFVVLTFRGDRLLRWETCESKDEALEAASPKYRAPKFVHRERVRYGDLDANRHLNNVVFQRYFETAWVSYRDALGVPVDPFIQTGFELIFAEFHINYRSPVQFDEELDITLMVSDIQRSSFRVGFDMRVGERLCAEGYGVYVGFDYDKQHATPLPDHLRRRLAGQSASAP
jgi:acyl-CoA thioester hydrolase